MRNRSISLIAATLFFLGAQVAHAYTYTYKNKTDYRIRVNVRLYDEGERTCEIEAGGACRVSTGALLKNWVVDLFTTHGWRRVLELNCDMFRGNHPFSIYAKESRNPDGTLEQKWFVENQ